MGGLGSPQRGGGTWAAGLGACFSKDIPPGGPSSRSSLFENEAIFLRLLTACSVPQSRSLALPAVVGPREQRGAAPQDLGQELTALDKSVHGLLLPPSTQGDSLRLLTVWAGVPRLSTGRVPREAPAVRGAHGRVICQTYSPGKGASSQGAPLSPNVFFTLGHLPASHLVPKTGEMQPPPC